MATVIKIKRSETASSVPTTSDLEVGEIAVNTSDRKVYIRDSGDSIVTVANFSETNDLSSIGQSLLPDTTETYDIGSASKRWRDIYLSGNTINLNGATISSDGTGAITISASGATLPVNSKIEVANNNTKSIALADDTTGATIRSVPFYSNSGGLNTPNAFLNFRAPTANTFVASFLLATGSNITVTADELFLF
jgi:hypothetical protein